MKFYIPQNELCSDPLKANTASFPTY